MRRVNDNTRRICKATENTYKINVVPHASDNEANCLSNQSRDV